MRIAAVIVTYNRCDMLARCLDHLQHQVLAGDIKLDVLVVDNASTDATATVVAKRAASLARGDTQSPAGALSAINYYNTGANLGGAGGFACGMRIAVEAGYDYLWVMDDDCLPDPGALQALLDAAATLDAGQPGGAESNVARQNNIQPDIASDAPTWGYLSSVAHWVDNTPCTMNIQRHPLLHSIQDFSPDLQPCTLASFVSLFVPAAVVREVGLPYAEFFIWTDDWEFTRRISRHRPCYVVGTSTVVHASATNNPGNIYTDPPERLNRYHYIYRNDVVLYREEGLRGIAFLFARGAYHTLRVLLSGIGQKGTRIALIWKGTLAGFSFHPTLIYPTTPQTIPSE